MQRGFTLIEILGALAIAAMITAGVSAMVVRSLDQTKGRQASLHQAQVTAAAAKYIARNYDTLLASATDAHPVAVPVSQLKADKLLSENFADANAYGQTSCLLVLQPATGKLDALVVTEGGAEAIPTKDLPAVAAEAGQGAGYVPDEAPLHAVGAFGSWSLPADVMAKYLTASCSGTPVAGGRLSSAIFFDSPEAADFVYRGRVEGHPELNRMTTPLHMAAVATEGDASDPLCLASDPGANGRIAVDSTGMVLSCQAGVWKRQGSGFWRDPVPDFAALPLGADNQRGDVRMVTGLGRAFTWNGTAWAALAVDESGNMSLPGTLQANYLQVNATETAGDGCDVDGLIAKDATGLLLSCHGGRWQRQSSADLAYTENGDVVILRSDYKSYPGDTVFYSGAYSYDEWDDWVYTDVVRQIVPAKDGLVIVNASSVLDRELTTDGTRRGQVSLLLSVVDRDSGAIVATTRAMSPIITNDTVAISATLSKAVPRNAGGYDVHIQTAWSTYLGSEAAAYYDRSNYLDAKGNTVEQTPLETNWTLDLTY